MKIVLITNNSYKSKYLEKLIVDNNINLVKVIRFVRINKHSEKSYDLMFFLRKIKHMLIKVKKIMFKNSVSFKAIEYELDCKAFYDKKLISYIKSKSNGKIKTGVETKYVENINSDQVALELKRISPDICVVWGTPILKKNILSNCALFINAHTSILPFFKGTRSEFWQCYENKPDKVGVTFHKIDVGVDTGHIIKQIHQDKIKPFESYHLRYQNTITIFKNYPDVILSAINGAIDFTPQKKYDNLKTYKSSDVTTKIRIECYKKYIK